MFANIIVVIYLAGVCISLLVWSDKDSQDRATDLAIAGLFSIAWPATLVFLFAAVTYLMLEDHKERGRRR